MNLNSLNFTSKLIFYYYCYYFINFDYYFQCLFLANTITTITNTDFIATINCILFIIINFVFIIIVITINSKSLDSTPH